MKRFSGKSRERLKPDALFRIELGAYLRVCESFDTPRSLTCYMLARYGEWDQLVDLPRPSFDSPTFPLDYGVTEMFRKNPRIPLASNREEQALKAWFEGEKLCLSTNERIWNVIVSHGGSDPYLHSLLRSVQREVYRILGPLRTDELDRFDREMRFGPGATHDVAGNLVLPSRKFAVEHPTATPSLSEFLPGILWKDAVVEFIDYDKLTFVPKDARKDRSITIGPHLNVYVQLAAGRLIRRRLEQFGLQCSTQENNRQAAKLAQRLGFATLDLSMASDTVCYRLVKALLPPRWFDLLELSRVKNTVLPDGTLIPLQKFSAMGNGYTWELQTVVFYALSRVVVRRLNGDPSQCLAYGDDIVVPCEAYAELRRALEAFGFKVNEKKSFWQGRFFESCGVDVYDGLDVRPYYFKGEHDDLDTTIIRYANGLRRYANRLGAGSYCDSRLYDAYRFLLKHSARARSTAVPEGYGDDGLVRDDRELQRYFAPRRGKNDGLYCLPVLRRRAVKSRLTDSAGSLTAWLHATRGRDYNPYVPAYSRGVLAIPTLQRNSVETTRKRLHKPQPGWLAFLGRPTSQLGPWCSSRAWRLG